MGETVTELILTGHSIQVTVRGGCLSIKDKGGERRIERVPRLYNRLVINGNIGIVTVEALAWMHDYGMEWCVLWRDRGIVAASVSGQGNPELWRKQFTANALPAIRYLTIAKIEGQARNAELLRENDSANRLYGYADSLKVVETITGLSGYEGKAAAVYWAAWRKVETPFLADHMLKIPPRWGRFGGRRSLAHMEAFKSNRGATDPVNAMLNYAYRVGESVCAETCYGLGLSPLIGLTHYRKHVPGRDSEMPRQSMALDLLEAVRPACDRVVLELLDYGQGIVPYLKWHDFLELESGVVRVESETLRERIIRGCGKLRDEVNGYAREIVRIL